MFTHVMVGCKDLAASTAFYDATFDVLGIPRMLVDEGSFYGNFDMGLFAVNSPLDGKPASHANGGTIGFKAADVAMVKAWHAAGLANGGTDEGAPGRRDWGEIKLYSAYLRDPVGNKLCVITGDVAED